MAFILGLDPSVKKSGYVVMDTTKPDTEVVEKGLLKTSPLDGILVQRLVKQAGNISGLMAKYNIQFVGMEAPFFDSHNTEMLFALNQYIHKVFMDREAFVVCFPPSMLKKLAIPDHKSDEVGKPHMIDAAKRELNLYGKRLAEDVADAYWAGRFGKHYYQWHLEGSLDIKTLPEYEQWCFDGKKEISRGPRKGVTDYFGIVYRENQLFYDFRAIKRRVENALRSKKETVSKKGPRKGLQAQDNPGEGQGS
jgi:Holliday junction resolvasome RuvABC endonuclease subunit